MPADAACEILVRDSTPVDVPALADIYAWHVLHGLASFEESPPGVEELLARIRVALRHITRPGVSSVFRTGDPSKSAR